VLTLTDVLREGSLAETQLNIMFSFAAIRLALPAIERQIWPRPALLAALALFLAALAPLTGGLVEYGTAGALLALVGLAHRRWLEKKDGVKLTWRLGLAALAGIVFVWTESEDYAFDQPQIALLVLLVSAVSAALLRFRREALAVQPVAPLAAALRFCGRHSLWLYAGQILLLAALAAALGIEESEDNDESQT